MEDRRLLELAAKAANMTHLAYREGWDCMAVYNPAGYFEYDTYWNPLKDDGDALRLAVKLHLSIEMSQELVMVGCDEKFSGWFEERTGVDPSEATRRAIVRASAEIGEAQN